MGIQFTKMHGLGNDFVVINALQQPISITSDFIRKIADRHFGIGCDQVLVIGKPMQPHADFSYHIYNADGNEVYQCGNGARCVGLFIRDKKLSDKKNIILETKRDLIAVTCNNNESITIDVAKPDFNPAALPFLITQSSPPYQLSLGQHTVTFDVVSVGNPHCVMLANSFLPENMREIGEQLNQHAAFPEGVNVGFVTIDSRNAIRLSVFERGAGMTKACGSGACAAVAVLHKQQKLDDIVQVQQAGGVLTVSWQSPNEPIRLTGPAAFVFEGVWENNK